MHSTRFKVIGAALLGAAMLLAACGSSSTSTTATIKDGKNCKHIAFLLPESATAARWEAADHPFTEAAIKADLPGATVDAPNAQGVAATQATQADSALTQGACILVVAPVDSAAAAAIGTKAKANTVIAALKAVHLNGKVLVTGQDAEKAGIRNILLGDQSMTVYKPIKKLAASVGQLVAAISKGEDTTSIANQQVKNPNGNAQIPSVLNAVVEVDISNIATTVIADGFVTKTDVCQGVLAGTGGVC